MLHCLRQPSSSATLNLPSSPPPLQATSTENTPRSSTPPSPSVNLTREYTLAVQTNSYSEIWLQIHPNNCSYQEIDLEHLEAHEDQQRLAHLLQPNREHVKEALRYARPSTLTRLVSAYFDHSEHTSQLCLLLHQSVLRARSVYAPLHDLLDVLPSDSESMTQSQCDRAFDVFLQFDCLDNPFPPPDSHNFNDMRSCFSELKQQLNRHLSKSHSRVRILHRVPLLPTLLPSKMTKKELAHLSQLEAAARGTYVLHNDLDTIDRLVARLHTAVEGDKLLIRLGLERGRDKHPIQEVVKQLCRNHDSFFHQLMDLEEHLCLCFTAINRARSLLLQEIRLHETQSS
ncbi:unnamed protein product [Ilex paraguariensis]|uniref:Uncharacterized protein n=1 Tax=Ilex paraguariensis TaxID=185542 RepID=A0ABC8SVL7_9AQUA